MKKRITRKMIRDRLKKYKISIDDLDKTAIKDFKDEMKKQKRLELVRKLNPFRKKIKAVAVLLACE